MTTSGVTSWDMTALAIIQAALHDNAIIPIDEVPEAAEADACLTRLNAILKSFPVGLHLETEASITVTAGVATVALDSDVDTVISARLINSATSERALARWEREDYLSLPNKTSTGDPTVFYVNEDTLYVWPVPTANATIKLDYLRKPETVTALSQTVDFPQKYQEALYSMLAVRCAGLFGAQPSQELMIRAERLRREVEDAERPSYYTIAY